MSETCWKRYPTKQTKTLAEWGPKNVEKDTLKYGVSQGHYTLNWKTGQTHVEKDTQQNKTKTLAEWGRKNLEKDTLKYGVSQRFYSLNWNLQKKQWK